MRGCGCHSFVAAGFFLGAEAGHEGRVFWSLGKRGDTINFGSFVLVTDIGPGGNANLQVLVWGVEVGRRYSILGAGLRGCKRGWIGISGPAISR